MRTSDTSLAAAAIQSRLHQALGPEARFSMAMNLSGLAREFAKAGVRERHPEFTEGDVLRELTRRLHGGTTGTK